MLPWKICRSALSAYKSLVSAADYLVEKTSSTSKVSRKLMANAMV